MHSTNTRYCASVCYSSQCVFDYNSCGTPSNTHNLLLLRRASGDKRLYTRTQNYIHTHAHIQTHAYAGQYPSVPDTQGCGGTHTCVSCTSASANGTNSIILHCFHTDIVPHLTFWQHFSFFLTLCCLYRCNHFHIYSQSPPCFHQSHSICNTSVTPLEHLCDTSVTPLQHLCNTLATLL
jgi:hypothetical protein